MRVLMNNFNRHMEGLYLNEEKDIKINDKNNLIVNDVLKKKWVNSDFADYGHFNKNGGIKFADLVFQAIKEKVNYTTKNKIR